MVWNSLVSRRIELKVFASDGNAERFTMLAPKGREFTELGIQVNLSNFVQQLDQQFPGNNFRAVRVGPAKFNVMPSAANA